MRDGNACVSYRARCGRYGRPAFDPQLLISLWVYAYSQGLVRHGKWHGGVSRIVLGLVPGFIIEFLPLFYAEIRQRVVVHFLQPRQPLERGINDILRSP